MGKVSRREFFEELIETARTVSEPQQDTVFSKYANKKLPPGVTAKTTGSLNVYAGPWTQTQVVHLLRRTMFGVRPAELNQLQSMSCSAAVDFLLNNVTPPASSPVNNYNNQYADTTGVNFGQSWVNAAYGDGTLNSYRRTSLKSWWTGCIVNQDFSIQEKMILFWHHHLAAETDTIGDARASWAYHNLLRTSALGNFKTLIRSLTTNIGMLRYLNGYLNNKNAPDENYARELMELFTLGKENVPNYTEDDVKAAAKVLTGWRINNTTLTAYFDPTWHHTSTKQFSSFFNNTAIAYQSGAAGANETDLLINMIFSKSMQVARHLCKNLYRFFVYYAVDSTIESVIVDGLAQTLIANNWEIKPVLAQLLKSDHFFELDSRGCYIRQPLDYLAGTFRTFNVTLPAAFTIDKTYAVWNYLRGYGVLLAQDLGDPPNVSGWPAFYQTPEFHEIWINSNTLPKRMAFTDMMLNSGFSAGTGSAIKIDVLGVTAAYPDADDPDLLVDYFCRLLLGLDVSANSKAQFKSILLGGQSQNYYWSNAWQDYLGNPNTANTNIVKPKLVSLLTTITRLPEHQLC